MSGVSSSTPYVSQQLKDLVKNAKAENKNEKANVVNQNEADLISNKISEETKGMSETDATKYVAAAEKYLNSEFQNTNVKSTFKLTDGTSNLKEATKFTFNISGKIETKKELPQDPKLVANGVDFNKEEKNTLKGSPDGEKIIKRYDYLASDKNNSLTGKPELNSASKEDLKGLKETFGNDANKFLAALKENPKFQTANIEDAKTILKYANEGCKSKDDVIKLQQSLKNVGPDLKERFEKNGKDLGSGKGIDAQYGFATMEGVRYLSSVMKKADPKVETETKEIKSEASQELLDKGDFTTLIPEDRQVMVAVDVSGSMTGTDKATLNKYDKVVKDNPKSDIGFMTFNSNSDGSGGEVMFKPGESNKSISKESSKLDKESKKLDEISKKLEPQIKITDDAKKLWMSTKGPQKSELYEKYQNENQKLAKLKNDFSEQKIEVKSAEQDLKIKTRDVVQDAVGRSEGTHSESGSKAAFKSLEQMDPKGKKPFVLVQTDEPDHNSDSMKQLIKDGISGKVAPDSVTFFNPKTKKSVSLEDLIAKNTTDGKFDETKFATSLLKHEGRSSFDIFK